MKILKDASLALTMGRGLLAARRDRKNVAVALHARGPLPTRRFVIGVYFADAAVNLYQLRQWYAPLVELSKRWPVVILSRNAQAATVLLAESPVPVAYVRSVVDLEDTIAEQDLKIVLYVNQNTRNFQMMRYGRRWHVFVNHGESDKMYMTTNQFKAYDYSLIAGDAARARLGRVLWDYDFDKRAIPIGRPQADHYGGTTPFPADDRRVILYAPTWEGDRAAASYGSIVSHGRALVRAVLADPAYRLVYRPHPRSGAVDPKYGRANREIIRLIADANRADASAVHVHDTSPELGWQLAVAELAVVDISAMVYDRLASGRPLLVTRPVAPGAEIDDSGYLADAEWLEAPDAASILDRLHSIESDPASRARLQRWVEHYFGDTRPGVATARFHEAIEHLLTEWDRNARLHAADPVVVEHDPSADPV